MEKVYKKGKGIITRKIENEVVILPSPDKKTAEKDCFFCLQDPTSVQIWKLIDGKRSVSQIIKEIERLFDADKNKIKNDVVNFISQLEKGSIIHRT